MAFVEEVLLDRAEEACWLEESWRELGSREKGMGRRYHPRGLEVCLAEEFQSDPRVVSG